MNSHCIHQFHQFDKLNLDQLGLYDTFKIYSLIIFEIIVVKTAKTQLSSTNYPTIKFAKFHIVTFSNSKRKN